jgi:membrane-associated protein
MNYRRFIAYNIVGGLAWVWSFLLLGYFFGNLPGVKKNFTLAIFAIILISVLPIVFEFIKARRAAARAA